MSDPDDKERLRALLAELPTGWVRVLPLEGEPFEGEIVGEHQHSSVSEAGRWSFAAGLTVRLAGGEERLVDLACVRAVAAARAPRSACE